MVTMGFSQLSRPHRARPTATEVVQEQVLKLIETQRLAAGAPLPTEPELVRDLGVSRNSVREALKALQAVGIVDIRHGYGTFVASASLDALAPSLTFHARSSARAGRQVLRDIVEVRAYLEHGLVRRAALELTEEQIGQAEAELRSMGAASTSGRAPHDRRFHELLYEPLDNQIASQLLTLFWNVYHDTEQELGEPCDSTDQAVQAHQRIIDALRSRDPGQAAAAMDAHFAEIRSRVAGPARD